MRNVVAKLSSARRMTRIGKSALWIEMIEPHGRLKERPSRLIRYVLALDFVHALMTAVESITSGRMVNEWGAIGDNTQLSRVGRSIGPPTDIL